MKKATKKLLALALAACLTVVSFAGCGDKDNNSSKSTEGTSSASKAEGTSSGEETQSALTDVNGHDISEYVELKMFAISDAPNDQEKANEYFEKLNAMLKEKLNCTIKVDYASGNNYQNNYQLAMSSGDQYDLMHSGSWLNYSDNALKGGFMDLTDLVKEYLPTYYERVGDAKWDGVKVDGKIYGVPTLRTVYSEPTFFYREDLREKYNVPEFKTLDDIGVYLQAIKDNEPELLPSDDYQAQVYGTAFITTSKYQIVDTGADRHSNFVIDPKDPTKVLSTLETPEFLPHMELMKKWADAGYWSKSVLNTTDWGVFSVQTVKLLLLSTASLTTTHILFLRQRKSILTGK